MIPFADRATTAEHAATRPDERTYRLHLAGATVTLLLAIWLSTGTLAPYAATTDSPVVLPPCNYLYNADHAHFTATYWLLRGSTREWWEASVVLRRILFPLLAYPWMRAFGFETGGVVASALLQIAAFGVFVLFLRRRMGARAAAAGAWLLATYPGISYWAGLPYAYAVIVPFSLFNFVLLDRLHRCENGWAAFAVALGMGVLATGYDFLPIFGTAALLVVLLRKRLRWMIPIAIALIAPTAAWGYMLRAVFQVPLSNPNSAIYGHIVSAWLHPSDVPAWLGFLKDVPGDALRWFFFGNFLFLPCLFLVVHGIALLTRQPRLEWPETAILVGAAIVFLANDAAPPYAGVQARGASYARLCQPIFVVFLAMAARAVASRRTSRIAAAACACTVLLNASVAFGPVLRVSYSADIYLLFYRHTTPDWMERNLQRYGRRPLGFCRSG